ncbi:MAG: 3'-5' exonuclease [Lachnospiraceae bacterium]|nr:3'-5' exonuclease [Lachnospiraceae bacterium]
MTEPISDYLCLDLETTGLNPKLDKIIEIGAVKVKGGVIADTFSTFIKPGKALTERVSVLTGIREQDLETAPTIQKVLPEFLEFAEELPLLGHRILFDFSFIKRAAVNEKLTFERSGIDTLKIARKYLPDLPSRRLSDLCEHYGIELHAHRALEDARATHFLYQKLWKEFQPDFEPEPLIYKVKREGPATKAQKQRLVRLLKQYGLTADCEIEMLTKNEASRLIDRILASYGILQK